MAGNPQNGVQRRRALTMRTVPTIVRLERGAWMAAVEVELELVGIDAPDDAGAETVCVVVADEDLGPMLQSLVNAWQDARLGFTLGDVPS